MGYRLFVTDRKGRSMNVVQPDHSRNGTPCFQFPDDKEFTLVLEHDTVITYFLFDADGQMLGTEQEEPYEREFPSAPPPKPRKRSRKTNQRKLR